MGPMEIALKELLETDPISADPRGKHVPLNHGPMAIETLETLGHEKYIPKWMDEYRPQLIPKSKRVKPIGNDWKTSLGKFELFADWEDYFWKDLQNTAWRQVLTRWLPV